MKGVLLDIEGVIRDSKNAFHHAYELALASVGLKLVDYPADTWRLRGFAEFNHQKEFLKAIYAIVKSGERVSHVLWKKYPVQYVYDLMKTTSPTKEEMERMEEAYMKEITNPRVLRRISPIRAGKKGVKMLNEMGFKIGAVTNAKKEYNYMWLVDREIYDYFDTIVTSEDAPQPKPAPDMILKACKNIGLQPKEVYYLGDSEADIMAAKAAGCTPIGIDSNSTEKSRLRELGAEEIYSSVTDFALKLRRSRENE